MANSDTRYNNICKKATPSNYTNEKGAAMSAFSGRYFCRELFSDSETKLMHPAAIVF